MALDLQFQSQTKTLHFLGYLSNGHSASPCPCSETSLNAVACSWFTSPARMEELLGGMFGFFAYENVLQQLSPQAVAVFSKAEYWVLIIFRWWTESMRLEPFTRSAATWMRGGGRAAKSTRYNCPLLSKKVWCGTQVIWYVWISGQFHMTN